MKKLILTLVLIVFAFSSAMALEPVRVAIIKTNGTAPFAVTVELNDYTGGTPTNILPSTSIGSLTPNSSGVMSFVIEGAAWTAIPAANVNSYYLVDIKVGGTLYAQYRLDELMILQAQTGNGGAMSNGAGAFTSSSGTTRANNTGDNFYVGQGDFNYSGSGTEYKMFFDRNNGSFRAGKIDGTQWDTRGISSFAVGYKTTATGDFSLAFGVNTTASGDYSTAMGLNTTASGSSSTALGYYSKALSVYSTAMGNSTTASGSSSTALGYYSKALSIYSTAMGNSTTASGFNSTAMGDHTDAYSYAETVIGSFNTVYTPTSPTSFNASDRQFVVGNGTSSARSDALIVYKSGDVVVPSLGGGGTQNLQVDNSGKIEASSTVSVHFSATAPTNPVTGSLWYDSANSLLKVWSGSSWVAI